MHKYLVLALILLAACFSACERPPAAGKKLFVMVPKGVLPYYGPCIQGFKDAAAKYGVDVDERTPREIELPQQVEALENVIASKPAGIAVSAVDDKGLKNVIDKAAAAGIKVITFDAPAPSTQALTYIGTLNPEAGYQAGLRVAELLKDQSGDVLVLQGGLGASNLNDRFDGFQRAIKEKAPKLNVVRENTEGKIELAVSRTENALTANPNIKAIFGVSVEGIPGAATVLKRQNKTSVLLAGFDDSPDALAAIRAGTCSFCIAQKTYKMGWMSVEKLLDACDGKPVEKQYDTGVIFVTKDNVETYMADMMKEYQK